jgi:ATP-binding cassette, subfamily C (CFTR/MRP), member 1
VGVLAVASIYTLISLAISLCILWFVQRQYLAISSQLRTLQIAAQAPVIGIIRASFDGRCTIRAFGMQESISQKLVDQQHQAQKSGYLFRSLQSWLLLVLDLLSTGIAGTLAALVVGLKVQINVSWAGVALVNTIVLGQDLKLMMHWLMTLEAYLGVIRRIRGFISNTSPEDDTRQAEAPADGWPLKGQISLDTVSCGYG